jgi:hypothetical protein
LELFFCCRVFFTSSDTIKKKLTIIFLLKIDCQFDDEKNGQYSS